MSSTAEQIKPITLYVVSTHTVTLSRQNDHVASPTEPYELVQHVKIKGVTLEITQSLEQELQRDELFYRYSLQHAVRLVQQLIKMLD